MSIRVLGRLISINFVHYSKNYIWLVLIKDTTEIIIAIQIDICVAKLIAET